MSLGGSDAVVAIIPTWVDVVAAGVGALSGGLVAVRARFDINGTLLLAIVTGLGGGIIRDVLLSAGPPVAFRSPQLLPTTLAVGLVVVIFARNVDRIAARVGRLVIVTDAVFLGVYSIVGTAKGLNAYLPATSCVLLGVLTGLGGGLIRDILVNEQPEVLRPGAFVAMTSVAGCTLYVVAVGAGLDAFGSVALAVTSGLVIVALRLLAVWRGWESPSAAELPAISQIRLHRRVRTTKDGETVEVVSETRRGPLRGGRGNRSTEQPRRHRRRRLQRSQDTRRSDRAGTSGPGSDRPPDA